MASSPFTDVRIMIERDETNRHLWLAWGWKDNVNTSYYQINGAQDQRIFYQTIKFRELGEFQVCALLVRNDESKVQDCVTVIVR